MERYEDSTGLSFYDVRAYMQKHYGVRVADWPSVRRVDDPAACATMHKLFNRCWECGQYRGLGRDALEAHHIGSQFKKKSDELTLIAMLCAHTHRLAKQELPFGRILFLKWKYDRIHLQWERVCLITRKFLPDLVTDEICQLQPAI